MRIVEQFKVASWPVLSVFLLWTVFSAGPLMAAQDALICPADRINSNGNICTASDVQLAAAAVAISQTGLTCAPGGTIDVAIAGTVNLRKGNRYDIGVWISTDGLPMDLRGGSNGAPDEGGAKTCEVVPLPSQLISIDNDPNVFVIDSFDTADTPQDCYDTAAQNNGDISSGFALTSERDSIINGLVDTSNDGVIDASDTTTLFDVFGVHVIAGALDMDGSGTIDVADTGVWSGFAVGGTGGVVDVDGDGTFGSINDNASQSFNDFVTLLCVGGPTGKLAIETLVSWNLPSDADDICMPDVPDSYGPLSSSKCSVNSSEVDVELVGKLTIKKAALVDDGTDFEFTYTNDKPPVADQDPNDAIPDLSPVSPFTLQVGDSDEIYAEIGTGPATIVITETNIPAGWGLKDLVCTGDDDVATVIDLENNQATVTLQYNDVDPLASQADVECVFTNGELPSLTVTKNTAGDNGVFAFNGNNGIGAFNIDTTTLNTGSVTFDDLAPGTDYNITETIPVDWILTSASCNNGSGTVVPDPDLGILDNISLALDEIVTCTFNNAVTGVSTFTKLTVGGDDTFGFSSTDLPGGDFSLSTSGGSSAPTAFTLPAGTYVITEDAMAGWDLTDLECTEDGDQDSTTDVPTRTITLRVQNGETINCEVSNAKHGTFSVQKSTTPVGDPAQFTFAGDLAGQLVDYTINNDELTLADSADVYTTTESALTGWDITGIACSGATNSTVSYGVDGVPNAVDPDLYAAGNNSVIVDLAPGEDVSCVFENTKRGSVTIVKSITATGPASQDFDFTSNLPGNTEFTLSPVDAVTTDELSVSGVLPGVYQVAEQSPVADGWALVHSSCSDGSPINAIQVNSGEDVTCTFINSPLGSGTIIKTSVGGSGQFDFTWGTVANPGVPAGEPANFSLNTTVIPAFRDFEYELQINDPYDLTETGVPGTVGGYLQSWNLTDVDCLDETGGSSYFPGQNGSDATIVADEGETVACSFTNTLDGTLVIRKQTIPDQFDQDFSFNGSPDDLTGSLKDFDIAAAELSYTGPPAVSGTTETVPAGWALTGISCTGAINSSVSIGGTPAFVDGDTEVSVDVAAGETVICTYTNTKQGSLTVIKDTVGGDGSFSFSHTVPDVATPFVIDTAVDDMNLISASLLPGSYMVTEFVPGGWDLTDIGCTGATDTTITIGLAGGFDAGDTAVTVDLESGEDIVCTFTNTERASLTLVKSVVNDHGGTAVETDWTLSADGPTPISGAGGVAATLVIPGSYDLTESAGPAGYTAGDWSCTAGTLTDATVALAAGVVATCTIVNDDDAASLALVKSVINDNGGTAVETDWILSAEGPTPLSGAGGVAATAVISGTYSLSESSGPGGYTAGDWSCTAGTLTGSSLALGLGEIAVCTIINNDQAANLELIKTVTNNNGGTALPTDWTLSAAGPTPLSGAGGVVSTPVSAGIYTLSESGGPAGYNEGLWFCTAGTLDVDELTLANGVSATCTINNNDIGPGLTLNKAVTNDHGGTLTPTDFDLHLTGGAYDGSQNFVSGATPVVVAGVAYEMSETPEQGYSDLGVACIDDATQLGVPHPVTLAPGQSVTCTQSNDDDPGVLTLVKTVTNDSGGTALATEWTLDAAGPTPFSGVTGSLDVTDVDVIAGSYTLSEFGGPAAYTPGTWSCTDGSLVGDQLTLAIGETSICTIDNDDDSAALTLVKTVTNDNGGTAAITDWTLSAQGPTPISGVSGDVAITDAAVNAGVYTLSESNGPDGYTAGSWSCTAGSLAGDQLTLALGESASCTINNDDDSAALTLVKTVTNDNGGTAVPTEWTLVAQGPTPISGVTGDTSITNAPVDAGAYTLSETNGPDGYTPGGWSCTAGTLVGNQLTLGSGESASCTIDNDDGGATLTLVKTVTNDNGGTAVATDWTISAQGPTPISGVSGDATITDATVDAGVYTLSESDGPGGYTAGSWLCTDGSLVGDQLTLVTAENATCTIDNDDDSAVLTLVKTVTNDNGGTAEATDWTLNADGPTPISGASGDTSVTDAAVDAGVYTLSESDGPDGYTAGSWSCSAGTLAGDQLTLGSGESASCTIDNDDVAPGLTLTKAVINDNGGSAAVTDWTLNADGPVSISGVNGDDSITGADVPAGVYTLSESDGPSGYTAGSWSCEGGSLSGDQLTVTSGETVVCSITNDDENAVLTLVKTVTNDNGGTAAATDWTLNAEGPTPISGVSGDASITDAAVDAGIYTLSETNGPDGYTPGSWSCTAGTLVGDELTLASGESASCTIDNDDGGATLTLVKTVNNDNGGTAVATDWTLNAEGPTPISGASGDAAITDATVDAGVYTLSESDGPGGYTAGSWSCEGGSLSGDELTLTTAETAVCSITNDDEPVLEMMPVPVNDKLALLLLTLMMLATAWYFRPVAMRRF